jgi:RNA polymerase-binding transcription factor DksA
MKSCSFCGEQIPEDRLEVLPDTKLCVECSRKNPEKKIYDPEIYCAKSSPSGQNGWTSKS